MNYRLAYAVGFHPWEDLAEHPPFRDKLLELVAHEEDGREPPYGGALDIGTGSAVWGIRLAERGWDVTGIDVVEKALRRARQRAEEAGVEMRLEQANVTSLREADVGAGFRLLLDTGTFHGLDDPQRSAMGSELSAVASADATVILDCFAPRRRGPLPRGASHDEVERAFPGWEIGDVEVADTDPEPIARLFRFDERFYRSGASDLEARLRAKPGVRATASQVLATDDQQQSTNVAVDAPLLCRANAAAWRGRPDPGRTPAWSGSCTTSRWPLRRLRP